MVAQHQSKPADALQAEQGCFVRGDLRPRQVSAPQQQRHPLHGAQPGGQQSRRQQAQRRPRPLDLTPACSPFPPRGGRAGDGGVPPPQRIRDGQGEGVGAQAHIGQQAQRGERAQRKGCAPPPVGAQRPLDGPQQPGNPRRRVDQVHVPVADRRDQARSKRVTGAGQRRRPPGQPGRPAPLPRAQPGQRQVQPGQNVQVQGRRQKERQPLRRVPDLAQRVGGEGRPAEDARLPQRERALVQDGAAQEQGVRPVGGHRVGEGRFWREGQPVRAQTDPQQKRRQEDGQGGAEGEGRAHPCLSGGRRW